MSAGSTRTVVYDRWYLEERARSEARGRPRPAPRLRIDKREADPRAALAAAIGRSGESYAGLSRMLGRPDGYLRRFVVDGVPRALQTDEHRRLSDFFGLDERALGIRDLWSRAP
ncbi:hypothetical protein [uncultured Sphingomonas sp.]|uniref:hypothetical protein n=1 Tax=uncultured Sphingomonas sp. TaxID=158754 RepID=UPI00259A2DB5|nr:hypothetical protein [uncultured Sphingomonas sp.]